MAGARDFQRLVEIVGLEPGQRAHALRQVVIPEVGDLDIERPLQPLIDGLNAQTGNGPLPANPINIAMQGHRSKNLAKGRK